MANQSQKYFLLFLLLFPFFLRSVQIEEIKEDQESSDSEEEYTTQLFDLPGTIKKILKENHFDPTLPIFTRDEKTKLLQKPLFIDNYIKPIPQPDPQKDRELLKTYPTLDGSWILVKDPADEFLEDCWVDDNKPTIDPLDLTLLDKKQSKQPVITFSDGLLYTYQKSVLDAIFKPFYDKNQNGDKVIRPQICHIRSIYRFKSKYTDSTKPPIVLFIGHGTWGWDNPDYYDPNTRLFRAFLNFAAWLARSTGQRIDVYVVSWSGDNTKQAREAAGLILARIVEMINHYYTHIIFKGFSHMGNVYNHASSNLVYARILLALYLATPTLDWVKGHAPHNIDWTIIKSSDDDGIKHWIGTWRDRLLSLFFWWRYNYDPCKLIKDHSRFGYHKEGIITNLDCMTDNTYSGHSIFPHTIINHVPRILKQLLTNYTQKEALYHLLVNMIPEETAQRLNIDPCNISLAKPQNTHDEARLNNVLPKIKLHSEHQEKNHLKAYPGSPKGVRWLVAVWYNRWRKILH